VSAVLACRGLAAGYGDLAVLRDVDLELDAGRVLVVLGPNGAGKTTLLTTMAGLLPSMAGDVVLDGAVLPAAKPHAANRAGLVLVPDDRSLFTTLSVAENLRAALPGRSASVDDVVDLFPALRKRWKVDAGSLSGGEQQMLAVGRALMANPSVLLLDEPSLGLAPRVTAEILETLGTLNAQGLSVVLVEQKAPLALKLARRAYLLSLGRIVAEIDPREVRSHDELARYYFAA
jgi:branched-chain amino acid transport system ATP-binding protein